MPEQLEHSNTLQLLTPQNMFNFLMGVFCLVLGWTFIISPWYISFGLLFGSLAIFLVFSYPIIGLYMFLFVIYIRPQDYYPILTTINSTRLVGILMIISFTTKMIFSRQSFVSAKQSNSLLLFTLVVFISSGISSWPENALTHWFDFSKKVIAYFVIINLVDSRKKFRATIWFFVLVNLIIAWTYIWQYFSGYGYMYGRLMGLTDGFLGNSDEIAIAFIVTLPLTVAHLLTYRNLWLKAFFGLGTLALFFCCVLTKSRGALLGVLTVLFLLVFIHRSWLKKVPLYQILFILLIAVFVLFRLRLTLSGLLERTNDFDDPAVVGRFDAWRSAGKMILARPLIGVGRQNFTRYWRTHFPSGSWGQRQVAHNIVLEVAAETGLIGIFLYLSFAFQCFKDWWRPLHSFPATTDDERYLKTILRCLLISILGVFAGGMFITVGFYWHIFLLVAFFVAAERNLYDTYYISKWQH